MNSAPCIGSRPLKLDEWTGDVPGQKALARINATWSGIDADALPLSENGAYGVWRKPMLHPHVLVAVLHVLGYPCRWRAISDVDKLHAIEDDWRAGADELERRALDETPWTASSPAALVNTNPWDVQLLRGWSRSIDKLLPPEGPRPTRGNRRFGKRRGVKRFRES